MQSLFYNYSILKDFESPTTQNHLVFFKWILSHIVYYECKFLRFERESSKISTKLKGLYSHGFTVRLLKGYGRVSSLHFKNCAQIYDKPSPVTFNHTANFGCSVINYIYNNFYIYKFIYNKFFYNIYKQQFFRII